MKTEVYSWRVSALRKAELKSEAHREGISLAALLEQITTTWLQERRAGRPEEEAAQAALRKRVMATVGTIRSGDPLLSRRASALVKEIIRKKHEKESKSFRRTN